MADNGVYAALDLGTNNCRLLVAREADEGISVIDSFSRIVRLGEGVGTVDTLSEAAMRRSLEALRICADKIRRHRVSHQRLFATEACRRAANGPAFLDTVRRKTGLDLTVIAPEEEARLAAAGCAPLIGKEAAQVLVYDIGGGSTELIWINLKGVAAEDREKIAISLAGGEDDSAGRIVDWISVPLGMATLHEKFTDVEDQYDRFKLMSWYFSEQVENFGPKGEAALDGLQMIGTSGATTTVAALNLKLPSYDRSQVDGAWLTTRAVRNVGDKLLGMSVDARARHPCVGRERAELILAGVAILNAILSIWPVERLRVGDRGLREGAIFGMIQKNARSRD